MSLLQNSLNREMNQNYDSVAEKETIKIAGQSLSISKTNDIS